LPNQYQILPNRDLTEISVFLRESEICVASDRSRLANVSTEYLKHVKHFYFKFDHGSLFHLRAGPRPVSASKAMHSSESEHSSDDSGAGDDPPRSSAVPNSLLQLQCAYASDSDSVVAATPEKQFEEEDGLSDGSEFHTPAQPSKRRRLPSVSPVQKRQVDVQDVDSDGFDRDSLFDPPSSRKRGFKRPRQPWSLVKLWSLVDDDREVVYEEIKAIMEQSLDEAGAKPFIKPNANSIAGWRPKQVSFSFLSIILLDINIFVLYYRTMWHAAPILRSILLPVHSRIAATAVSNFEFLRPRSKSSWKHRVSILPRAMFKTRFPNF
jgi:hypothetical protein